MAAIDLNGVRRQKGYVLRSLRKRRGQRLPEVAALIGTSRTRLDKIERGTCRISFRRLAAAIDLLAAEHEEVGLLMALDLLDRVGMLPEGLQQSFNLASADFSEQVAAATEGDPVARRREPDRTAPKLHRRTTQ